MAYGNWQGGSPQAGGVRALIVFPGSGAALLRDTGVSGGGSPAGWHGVRAVRQRALEVHGHVPRKPGRFVRLAALPARHAPVIQPHCIQ